jgi:CSLREA domain-containing protein
MRMIKPLTIVWLAYSACGFAAIPVNDTWANRTLISSAQLAAGYVDVQDIAEATSESTDPTALCEIGDPQTIGNTVWYGLTVGPADVYLKSSTGTALSSILLITTGSPGNFKTVVGGCNDDGGANLSAAIDGLKLSANATYSIMVARPAQAATTSALSFSAGLASVKRVTKTADTNDGDCSALDCSLREAVQSAGGGAIELPAGNYVLTLTGRGEDAGNTGDLDISKGTYIYGAGAGLSNISMIGVGTPDRLIDIDPGFGLIGPTVSLNYLTLIGGSSGFGPGGCLRSGDPSLDPANEFVVLNNVVVTDCSSSLGGGAIHAPSAPLHLYESTVKNSLAGSGGGGIVFGRLTGVSLAQGTIERSTISGNTTDSGFSDGGGGIQNRGSLVLISSTISGNRAKFHGGGVLVTSANGRLNISDSTISNNIADYDGNGSGLGGGLRFDVAFSSATAYVISNTVLADNRIGSIAGSGAQDCQSVPANTLNVFRSWLQTPDATCVVAALGNTINMPAMLGALANNGGPTQTAAPLPLSPLIDNSSAGINCGAFDQRGFTRPIDGDGNGSVVCDIGAIEVSVMSDFVYQNGFETP